MMYGSQRKPVFLILNYFIFICALFPCVAAAWPSRGMVINRKIIGSYTQRQIAALLTDEPSSEQPKCNVRVVEMTYTTVGVVGEPTRASGVVLVPDGPQCPGPYPVLGWGRDGQTFRPSEQAKSIISSNGDNSLVTRLASQGYVVVSTDYLGLGGSNYPYHPYLHANSEASALIDALRASRTVLQSLNTPLSNKLMLSGFSQGAHAAMAAQREIEMNLSNEFNLVASGLISGPYALSKTFIDTWTGRNEVGENNFAIILGTYAIVGMQRTYRNIYSDPSQVFQDPWANQVEALFPGEKGRREVFDYLPDVKQIKQYLQPGFYSDFPKNRKNPFFVDLVRNDLLNWAPRTPTLLCGSDNDTVVPFLKNTNLAIASFKKRGSRQVSVVDVGTGNREDNSAGEHFFTEDPCILKVRQQLLDKQR
ncbi:lipase family protein [Xylella fastidiosa]|uniref:lipase family protein n=2 Tax=Xylella fastidiosa TaxID=2371 RepID=UPI00080ADA1A|nr:lipase family protein [Xylella fastidiosa]ALQ96285.1 alpha/beta hydrolase [Xylella fastidiosa]OCA58837.1 lipase [Xylella fastidiosa subsp. pauca 11399]